MQTPENLDWKTLFSTPASERASYSDVILRGRLELAIDSLNPKLPLQAREEALRRVLVADSPSLIQRNRAFHKMLRDRETSASYLEKIKGIGKQKAALLLLNYRSLERIAAAPPADVAKTAHVNAAVASTVVKEIKILLGE